LDYQNGLILYIILSYYQTNNNFILRKENYSRMEIKPRHSIKKYILILVVSASIGVILSTIVVSIIGYVIGFGSQGVLVIVVLSCPFWFFSVLYGFYKGLIKYYGFKENEKLFFGGKF